ncbi:hypothetical protein L596_002145 [Steinernema carpocapsae]|uniref:Uncharacterized protein n=1 Tax=Steinernema carpocapsae TaxID=34508 RepID=A0A4U8UQD2_STECR|nr:hypothetical protein L596_002145 [Steinernema carpocapsae]
MADRHPAGCRGRTRLPAGYRRGGDERRSFSFQFERRLSIHENSAVPIRSTSGRRANEEKSDQRSGGRSGAGREDDLIHRRNVSYGRLSRLRTRSHHSSPSVGALSPVTPLRHSHN